MASSLKLRDLPGRVSTGAYIEIATGVVLLSPFVSSAVAGVALTAFSGSLVAMYARTPALREPGSIWPSRAGIAVSKDVWMLASVWACWPMRSVGDDRSRPTPTPTPTLDGRPRPTSAADHGPRGAATVGRPGSRQ